MADQRLFVLKLAPDEPLDQAVLLSSGGSLDDVVVLEDGALLALIKTTFMHGGAK